MVAVTADLRSRLLEAIESSHKRVYYGPLLGIMSMEFQDLSRKASVFQFYFLYAPNQFLVI